ncbi:MAG: hypothetical protein ACI8XW_000664 [Gammaproteobacteria bacterium]|jgi:hypothetical protein
MAFLWLYALDEWVIQVNIRRIVELLWEENIRLLNFLAFSHGLGQELPFVKTIRKAANGQRTKPLSR